MKQFLLPHACKQIGQVMIVAMLLLIMASITIEADTANKLQWLMDAAKVMLYLSIVLITLSREKNEDEMTAHLRGDTLKEVAYCLLILYVGYNIVKVFVGGDGYILHDEELITPFIAWVAYYARFENKLKKLRKREFKL